MSIALEHRGPNSKGSFHRERLILAMRRLSIIDLTGGQQPLFNETGKIAIVCNGEIYNHRELRQELESLGHRFATHSDVETIVHAYEEYDTDCLSRLRGMFAFALWDGRCSKLFLARDRMGEKPLYLHRDNYGRLWFASELRSLSFAMEKFRLTAEAFNLFLAFQYLPEPSTPLEGVQVLPAGHLLVIDPDHIDGEPRPYWRLSDAYEDRSQPVKVVEQSLDEACRLMGTADVPVAVALSGGIDSSLVAALTAKHYPGQLHAFTIGYQGRPAIDERNFASVLAKRLNIGFTEVELTTEKVVGEFPAMIAAMDTPIGDIAAYGYFAVCRAARAAGFPVLLSGMGGDEFFWGYQWVREAVVRNQALLAGTGPEAPWWQRLLGRELREKPEFFGIHPDLRNGDSWSRQLLPQGLRNSLPPDLWLNKNSLDLSQPMHLAVSELLNRTWLRSNCLALVDRMSMAHSVEVRLPLLDVDLVNRVTGMRNAGLDDWNKPHKWLLIEALRDVLPCELLARKKQGFTPPIRDWTSRIVDRYAPLIVNGALVRQGLVDPHRARGELNGFDLTFLYKLVLLECWVRLHVEKQSLEQLLAEKQAV
jgi:asparagine synthase (glutamine-hydrolysing)